MSATDTRQITNRVNGTSSITGSISDTGVTDVEIPLVGIPASTTNQAFTMAFTLAAVQFFVFLADQPSVIKTNITSSPGDTINLSAGIFYYWSRSGYAAQSLTHDVTSIFVTTTNSTNFRARAITT